MEKAWHKNYQEGVPHNINEKEYESIPDVLEQAFNKFGNKPSFYCMGKTFSFTEMDYLSKKFASYLQNDLKLKKGSRVALMMPNVLQYPVALFGVLRAGMVAVNVNPLYTERELEHQLKDSGSETIIIFQNSASILEKVIKKTPVKNVIVTGIGDLLGFPKSLIVNFVIKNVKKMIPAWNLPGHVKFNAVLAAGNEKTFKKESVCLEDTAFLQYTGGTTGVSKGAVLTHGNICANMIQARAWLSKDIKEGEEIIITPLPLYHIFSLTANCFIFSSIGALNVLITNPRDLDGFIKELGNWKFTAFTGVNTLFKLGNHAYDKEIEHQIENIADNKWHQFSFVKNSVVANFDHGNSILSKYPILEQKICDLTLNKFEKRCAIFTKILIDHKEVIFVCTHLNLRQRDRISQAKMILIFFSENYDSNSTLILGGDLNDWTGEVTKYLKLNGGLQSMDSERPLKTFPSFFPILALDKILVKNAKIGELKCGSPSNFKKYSDHLPIFCEIEI